jgi:hypothetical protein
VKEKDKMQACGGKPLPEEDPAPAAELDSSGEEAVEDEEDPCLLSKEEE